LAEIDSVVYIVDGFISSPIGAIFVGFVSGVLTGLAVGLLKDYIQRPILMIEGNESIVVRQIRIAREPGVDDRFAANRIRVRNAGRSAAEDCKVYIDYPHPPDNPERGKDTERGAWVVPYEKSGYTLTLNVHDMEFVDVSAISLDGQIRVVPLEYGYTRGTVNDSTVLPETLQNIVVRITSSNAAPVEGM
jgi:hypothetical protein